MTPVGILGWLLLLLAIYCGIDPFKHSAIYHFPDFETFEVNMPPWSQVPTEKDTQNLLQKSEIRFLNQVQGPESMAFDPQGRGPYTGVADGRILFWNGDSWTDFAYTSPNRSELCDPKPSPLSYMQNEHICGRPLGLRFDKKTGDLYIADAYFGLMKVGPEGGLATSLATEAEGIPLRFTNDLDIDDDGYIYFTDSSTKYQRRLRKYWLKGEKAGTSEVMAVLPGFPDNVRTNEKGEFWVAIHCRRSMYTYLCSKYPKIRKFLLKLPISAKIQFMLHIGGLPHGVVVKYSPEGKLLQVLEDSQGKVVKAISEVEEKDGKLWMGSVLMPFVAVYQLG
ncbi:protein STRICTOSIDINE SYNTHASE-LIKE 3-like isoform X2 [Cornus florida]|uniref:protein STRICTOSIDINE SYNTHASE-LIKE 3-like isoform X2 n=1 Tax=Cornus florida TaxID=4283 RepID=UPI00289F6B40|nr:protein STRICTOSIDINE SYNTHASE-LIKE 3-like isoform X2 [Cornus florida]